MEIGTLTPEMIEVIVVERGDWNKIVELQELFERSKPLVGRSKMLSDYLRICLIDTSLKWPTWDELEKIGSKDINEQDRLFLMKFKRDLERFNEYDFGQSSGKGLLEERTEIESFVNTFETIHMRRQACIGSLTILSLSVSFVPRKNLHQFYNQIRKKREIFNIYRDYLQTFSNIHRDYLYLGIKMNFLTHCLDYLSIKNVCVKMLEIPFFSSYRTASSVFYSRENLQKAHLFYSKFNSRFEVLLPRGTLTREPVKKIDANKAEKLKQFHLEKLEDKYDEEVSFSSFNKAQPTRYYVIDGDTNFGKSFCFEPLMAKSGEEHRVECLSIPPGFNFKYIDCGEDYAISINPYFNSRHLLYYRGKIICCSNSSNIQLLGNNYISCGKWSEIFYCGIRVQIIVLLNFLGTSVEGDFLIDSTRKILLWKCLRFDSHNLRKEAKVFKREKKSSLQIFDDLMSSNMMGVGGQKDNEFGCSFYINDHDRQECIIKMYDPSAWVRIAQSLLDMKRYDLLAVFGKTCLSNIVERGVYVFGNLESKDGKNAKFTDFCPAFQQEVINLMYSLENTESDFRKIPKDVVLHKIIPFLSEIHSFLKKHSFIKSYIETKSLSQMAVVPGWFSIHDRRILTSTDFSTVSPWDILTSLSRVVHFLSNHVAIPQMKEEVMDMFKWLAISLVEESRIEFGPPIPSLLRFLFQEKKEETGFVYKKLRCVFFKFLQTSKRFLDDIYGVSISVHLDLKPFFDVLFEIMKGGLYWDLFESGDAVRNLVLIDVLDVVVSTSKSNILANIDYDENEETQVTQGSSDNSELSDYKKRSHVTGDHVGLLTQCILSRSNHAQVILDGKVCSSFIETHVLRSSIFCKMILYTFEDYLSTLENTSILSAISEKEEEVEGEEEGEEKKGVRSMARRDEGNFTKRTLLENMFRTLELIYPSTPCFDIHEIIVKIIQENPKLGCRFFFNSVGSPSVFTCINSTVTRRQSVSSFEEYLKFVSILNTHSSDEQFRELFPSIYRSVYDIHVFGIQSSTCSSEKSVIPTLAKTFCRAKKINFDLFGSIWNSYPDILGFLSSFLSTGVNLTRFGQFATKDNLNRDVFVMESVDFAMYFPRVFQYLELFGIILESMKTLQEGVLNIKKEKGNGSKSKKLSEKMLVGNVFLSFFTRICSIDPFSTDLKNIGGASTLVVKSAQNLKLLAVYFWENFVNLFEMEERVKVMESVGMTGMAYRDLNHFTVFGWENPDFRDFREGVEAGLKKREKLMKSVEDIDSSYIAISNGDKEIIDAWNDYFLMSLEKCDNDVLKDAERGDWSIKAGMDEFVSSLFSALCFFVWSEEFLSEENLSQYLSHIVGLIPYLEKEIHWKNATKFLSNRLEDLESKFEYRLDHMEMKRKKWAHFIRCNYLSEANNKEDGVDEKSKLLPTYILEFLLAVSPKWAKKDKEIYSEELMFLLFEVWDRERIMFGSCKNSFLELISRIFMAVIPKTDESSPSSSPDAVERVLKYLASWTNHSRRKYSLSFQLLSQIFTSHDCLNEHLEYVNDHLMTILKSLVRSDHIFFSSTSVVVEKMISFENTHVEYMKEVVGSDELVTGVISSLDMSSSRAVLEMLCSEKLKSGLKKNSQHPFSFDKIKLFISKAYELKKRLCRKVSHDTFDCFMKTKFHFLNELNENEKHDPGDIVLSMVKHYCQEVQEFLSFIEKIFRTHDIINKYSESGRLEELVQNVTFHKLIRGEVYSKFLDQDMETIGNFYESELEESLEKDRLWIIFNPILSEVGIEKKKFFLYVSGVLKETVLRLESILSPIQLSEMKNKEEGGGIPEKIEFSLFSFFNDSKTQSINDIIEGVVPEQPQKEVAIRERRKRKGTTSNISSKRSPISFDQFDSSGYNNNENVDLKMDFDFGGTFGENQLKEEDEGEEDLIFKFDDMGNNNVEESVPKKEEEKSVFDEKGTGSSSDFFDFSTENGNNNDTDNKNNTNDFSFDGDENNNKKDDDDNGGVFFF